MFNILHLADIHLGAVPYGMRARGNDIDYCLLSLQEGLAAGRWDAVIIAGDALDQAQANPADHAALSNFLGEAAIRDIPVYWIEGDHDSIRRDKVRRDRISWPDVMQRGAGFTVCPERLDDDGLPVSYTLEKQGHRPLTVCPINWRPGVEIKALLERIPQGYCDIMIMHQSLEGVIPAIANPEIRIQDIDGKAAHFALGDLHVNYAGMLPSGAWAAYPGPIEWLATDQAGHTGYREIDFREDGVFVGTTHVRTPSRRLVRLQVSANELIDLTTLMPDEPWPAGLRSEDWIEVGSPGNSVRICGGSHLACIQGRYFFDIRYFHSPSGEARDLGDTVKQFLEANVSTGLARVTQVPSVDSAQTYTESTQSDSEEGSFTMTMEEAIRQQCVDEEDPRILDTALDIWANPGSVKAIIDHETQETETP